MQNPSVMALYLPVASRLSSRTGLSLSRLLLPLGGGDRDGRRADHGRQLAADPAQRPAGRRPTRNLPSGAATLEPLHDVRAAADRPRAAGRRRCCTSASSATSGCATGRRRQAASRPARTQSYFAKAYGIEGDVYELTVSADSPLVGMSLGEAEALHGAPLLLALKTGNESRLAPPADARIWVGSVLGAMGPTQQVSDFAQNNFLRLSSRLRNFADLFNPSRAGISEAVVPPTSQFIGKTAGRPAAAQAASASACWRSTATSRCCARTCASCRCAPATCWCCTASGPTWRRPAESKDFVVVTDYPKGEQRPHKFKIAMAIFAVSMLLALSTRAAGVDRADDRRRRHAGRRRAAHRRGLRRDQLEDRVPDGLPDPAGLGDGFQRRGGVGRADTRSSGCRDGMPVWVLRSRARRC